MGGRDLGATGLLITLVLFQDPPVPLATSCLPLGLQSSVLGLGVGTRETGWGGGHWTLPLVSWVHRRNWLRTKPCSVAFQCQAGCNPRTQVC